MTPPSLGIFSRIGLRSTFQLLIALAAALVAASGFAATEVGAIPGSFTVSATGAATYSIPIAAPAGIRGLNPHLALTYSSQSGNGLAGWGWNLAGLSAITVCPKTLDQDGTIQGVSFTGTSNAANDFCLDGSKLMLASGSYGAASSTYRKEIDDFSRVTAYTAGGVGASPSAAPQYFTVETGDGTTYEYGMTADSEIVAVGPDIASGIVVVRAWALDKIYDKYGNSVDFAYSQDTVNGDYWPVSITWTNNNGSGGLHKITFSYDTLTGGLLRSSYLAGAIITQTKRLNGINVKYNGAVTYAYTLTYDNTLTDSGGSNTGTERSRLRTVTECAGATCFPATTVGWQSGTSGWGANVDTHIALPGAANIAAMQVIDVNGDGLPDIVYPGSTYWMVMFGNGSGFNAPVASPAAVTSSTYAEALPINVDGGNLTGLLVPNSAGNWTLLKPNPNNNYLLTTTALVDTNGHSLPATGAGGNSTVVDLDGDGLPDILYSDGTNLMWYRNHDGATFEPGVVFGSGSFSNVQNDTFQRQFTVMTPDFDGDGKGDMVSVTLWNVGCDGCNGPYMPKWAFHIGGATPTTLGTIVGNTGNFTVPEFVDFNGDGNTDALYADGTASNGSNWTWQVYQSDGAGLTGGDTGQAWSSTLLNGDSVIVDYAGNGRQEIMGTTGCPGNATLLGYAGGVFNSNWDSGIPSPACDTAYNAGSLHGYTSLGTTIFGTAAVGTAVVTTAVRQGVAGVKILRALDVNGDGLVDLVWAENGTWHYRLHNGVYPDLVTSINNGFSQTFTVSYKSLSNGANYTEGSGAIFPVRDFQGAMYVVDNYTGNDGIGGTYSDSYVYSGAQVDVQGRGFLGFATVNVTETRSNAATAETDTTYSQAFPYIGSITKVTQLLAGNKVHIVSNVYPGAITTVGHAVYAAPPTTTAVDCDEGSPCNTGTANYRKSVTTPTVTVSGGLIHEYKTEAITNPGSAIPGNFDSITDTTYYIDTGDWCNLLPSGVTFTRSDNNNTTPANRSITYTNSGSTCSRSTASITDPISGQTLSTIYIYDSTYGNLQSVCKLPAAYSGQCGDNNGRLTSFGYDATVDPTHTYVTSITVSPDGTHHITSKLSWYPDTGLKDILTDPNGVQTTWIYDSFGVLTAVSNPDGTSVGFAYSLCGNNNCGTGNANAAYSAVTTHYNVYCTPQPQQQCPSTTAGATATVVYDGFGRGLLQSSYLLNDQLDYVQTSYDSLGRVTAVSTPYIGSPSTWTYTSYDDLNRPLAVYAPAGQDGGCSTSHNGETTCETSYSYTGLTSTVTNAENQQTSSITDAIGQMASITDAANGVTQYQYDNFGDLKQTTDAAGHITTMGYDGWGRKITMSEPSLGTWNYSYTPYGELHIQTDAKGQQISMIYDGLGRLQTRTEPLPAGGNGTSTWTYDGPGGVPTAPYEGQIYQLQSADGNYARAYQYDGIGRPSEVDTTIGATTYATSTGYDSFGRVANVTYPSAPAPIPDVAPIANAGSNQTVNVNTPVTLDGSGSSDPDSGPQPLTFRWAQVDGPPTTGVAGATSVQVSFTPSTAGTYDFMLTVSDGELTNSAAVSVTVKPLVPTNLAATTPNPGNGNFNLTWTAATGDASYQLEEKVGSGNYALLPGTYTSPTTLSRSDGTYHYAVQGCSTDLSACSAFSAAVAVTELRTPGVPTMSNITPNPSTTGLYSVPWNTPSGTITYYKLFSSTDGSNYDSGTNVGNVNSWSPPSAMVNGTYYYKAEACNSGTCSTASNVKSVVVNRPVPGAPTMQTPNPATLPQQGGNSTLSWTYGGSVAASSYNLQSSLSTGFSSPYTYSPPITTKSYTVSTVLTRYYRVQGCNSAGCGAWSNTATVTVSTGGGGGQAPVQAPTGGSGTTTTAPAPTTSTGPTGAITPPQTDEGLVAAADSVARPVVQASGTEVVALAKTQQTALATTSPSSKLVRLRQAALEVLAVESRAKRTQRSAPVADREIVISGASLPAQTFAALRTDGQGGIKSSLLFAPLNPAPAPAFVPATGPTYARYQVDYVYDDHENLTKVVDDANPTTMIYWQATSANSFGQVTSEILGNGIITTRTFDPATGTLKTEQSGVGNGTGVANHTYSWDAVGNLSSRVDNNTGGLTDTFTYGDPLNRLTGVTTTGANATVAPLSLTYDAVGNIQTKSDMGTYAYDPIHPFEIASITPASGPARTFTYDNTNGAAGNGNLVNDGVRAYVWNAENKPIQITVSGSSQTFAYTPDGMRYQESTQGAITTTLTEVTPLFQVTNDGTNTYYKESILGRSGVVAIRTLRSLDGQLTTRYLTGDHLSSVTTVSDESGNVTCTMSYDALGNRRNPSTGQPQSGSGCDSFDTPDRGYTYQQELDALNLIHMNGRVYDPQVGRMVSADPFVQAPGNSQSFNRYAYVFNNPLTNTDPTGYFGLGDLNPFNPSSPLNPVSGPINVISAATGGAINLGFGFSRSGIENAFQHFDSAASNFVFHPAINLEYSAPGVGNFINVRFEHSQTMQRDVGDAILIASIVIDVYTGGLATPITAAVYGGYESYITDLNGGTPLQDAEHGAVGYATSYGLGEVNVAGATCESSCYPIFGAALDADYGAASSIRQGASPGQIGLNALFHGFEGYAMGSFAQNLLVNPSSNSLFSLGALESGAWTLEKDWFVNDLGEDLGLSHTEAWDLKAALDFEGAQP